MAALVDRAHMTHVSHDRVVLLIIHIRARARDLWVRPPRLAVATGCRSGVDANPSMCGPALSVRQAHTNHTFSAIHLLALSLHILDVHLCLEVYSSCGPTIELIRGAQVWFIFAISQHHRFIYRTVLPHYSCMEFLLFNFACLSLTVSKEKVSRCFGRRGNSFAVKIWRIDNCCKQQDDLWPVNNQLGSVDPWQLSPS